MLSSVSSFLCFFPLLVPINTREFISPAYLYSRPWPFNQTVRCHLDNEDWQLWISNTPSFVLVVHPIRVLFAHILIFVSPHVSLFTLCFGYTLHHSCVLPYLDVISPLLSLSALCIVICPLLWSHTPSGCCSPISSRHLYRCIPLALVVHSTRMLFSHLNVI